MSELEQLEKRLSAQFVKAMATFQLIADGDRILVGLSGGKDSLCLLEMLARRATIHHPQFSIEALHVRMENVHYESDTTYLQHFCDDLGVRLHLRTTRFEVSENSEHSAFSPKDLRRQKSPCFLCSWMRRKQLFNLAQELGCNKIALGHHQDDMIHTALMNLTFQGRFDTMPARLQMRKMPLSIIRPLCLMREADILRYAELRGYQKQQKLCPYEHDTHRSSVKALFLQMEQLNPEARNSLWRSLVSSGKLIDE